MLSGFLILIAQSILPQAENKCYEVKIEHCMAIDTVLVPVKTQTDY